MLTTRNASTPDVQRDVRRHGERSISLLARSLAGFSYTRESNASVQVHFTDWRIWGLVSAWLHVLRACTCAWSHAGLRSAAAGQSVDSFTPLPLTLLSSTHAVCQSRLREEQSRQQLKKKKHTHTHVSVRPFFFVGFFFC